MDKVCAIDWGLTLEYIKVVLSWPPMAVLIVAVVIVRFQKPLEDLINRIEEGDIFGQTIKAPRPVQQVDKVQDKLAEASKGQAAEEADAPLPPELLGDPNAHAAVEWVKNNPAQTVIEYKNLMFSYGAERVFNRIYGTQVEMLEYLSHCENPVTLMQLNPFHERHQAIAGSHEYLLKDYVDFLVNFLVVQREGSENIQLYKITDQGIEFLSYIKKHYPMNWNQRLY